MTYSNITYIGAYSLIAFCSVITHTILPIPPTVIFFCLSSLGITMAQSIKGFEPLPVTASVVKREKMIS
jgi:membrane protein YqaA with SNARE-associated domain